MTLSPDTKNMNDPVPQDPERVFARELEKFNANLIRFNSYRMVFLRGIISGVAGAIGATIIAALLFSLLAQTIQRIDTPFLNNLLKSVETIKILDTTHQAY